MSHRSKKPIEQRKTPLEILGNPISNNPALEVLKRAKELEQLKKMKL